jgi:hypothetical protein
MQVKPVQRGTVAVGQRSLAMHHTPFTMGLIGAAASLILASSLMQPVLAGQAAQADVGCARPTAAAPARKAAAVNGGVVKPAATIDRAARPKAGAQPADPADDTPADHEREVWRHQGVG